MQLQNRKTAFFRTPIFKFYLLSPQIYALLLPVCSTSSGNFFFRGGVCRPFWKVINIFACTCPNRSGVGAIDITSQKTWKNFQARHFDGPSSKNEHFWRFKDFYKQNYLLYALLKETWGNCAEEVCPSFFHRTSTFFSRNSRRFSESSRVSREKYRGPMEERRAYCFRATTLRFI